MIKKYINFLSLMGAIVVCTVVGDAIKIRTNVTYDFENSTLNM